MSRSRSLAGAVCVAVVVVGIMFGLDWLFPTAAMGIAGAARNLIRWVGPLAAGVLAAAVIVALASDSSSGSSSGSSSDGYSDGYGSRRRGPGAPSWAWATASLVAAAAVVIQVGLWAQYRHMAGQEAAESVTVTSELPEEDRPPVPSFLERRPYDQARTLIQRNRGAVPGELVDVTHVGDGRWTGLFSRPQGIVGVVEWDEAGTRPGNFRSCLFDDRPHAVDGSWWRNLRRDIAREYGWLRVADSDVYGVCDGESDEPVVYVPATRHEGFWAPHPTPAGVVVVSDGGMAWDRDAEPGEHPGPVYPLSVVEWQQTNAQTHSGSVGDSLYSRRLWYVEDDDEGEGSSQSGNTGEFTVVDDDGRLWYVTPARRRKEGPQIRALIVTPADTSTEGAYNPMTIHVLDEPRPAFSRVTEATEALLSTSGLVGAVSDVRVIEITPAAAGGPWVGTVVRGGEPIYRVEADTDETICLWAVSYGGPPSETAEPLACSDDPAGATGAPDPGDAPDPGSGPAGDLSELTDSELADLLADIAAELDARAAAP